MATSPQVNTTTGEIVDEIQIRPFAELLTMLDHGQAHAEASRALHDLVAAVRDVRLHRLEGGVQVVLPDLDRRDQAGQALGWGHVCLLR